MSVDVVEYRNGNDKENSVLEAHRPRALSGRDAEARHHRLARPLPVARTRFGTASAACVSGTVTVQLLSEDHTAVVQTWKLLRARAVKHVSGPFNALCSDVAIEELTLAYERLELE